MTKILEMHAFEGKLAQAWPPTTWGGVSVLVAVSGGPDSMALLRAMHSVQDAGLGRLAVAHFNHRLRGRESDADEAFVAEVAARLHCPYEAGYPPDGGIITHRGDGLEAAARRARYQFLTRTAAKLAARYVAVAHTADDQAETILHRILRGTGIGGLAGMGRVRPLSQATTLIRPLLGFRRAEICDYLKDIGQSCRLDATNLDPRRTRNRIRHHLLPELAARFNPDVAGALLRLGSLAGEVQSVVEALVEQLVERSLSESTPCGACIELSRLQGESRYLLREVFMAVWRRQGWPLRHMGFEQWEILATMTKPSAEGPVSPPQRRTFPGGVLAEISPGRLQLRRLGQESPEK
jgi:tRNA(Ile)-lysidine synthase